MTCGIQGKSNAEDDDQVCLFDVIQSKTETLSRNTQNWHLKIFNKENFLLFNICIKVYGDYL